MLLKLFLSFLKIGAFGWGGGYAMLPLAHTEFVDNWPVLTQAQFADALAISQATPGPVAIISTFVGYKLAGLTGAFVATGAMMLPSIAVMTGLMVIYKKIHGSHLMHCLSLAVIPVVAGMMLGVAFSLSKTGIVDYKGVAIFIAALGLTFIKKVDYSHIIIGAAITGILLYNFSG